MKHVLVTGGSRGLGLRFVEGLLGDGYKVSTCSRRSSPGLDSLLDQHKGRLFYQQLDLMKDDPEGFVTEAVAWAAKDGLYGVVNNAAIAIDGVLATLPRKDIETVIQTNITVPLLVSRAASRILLKQNCGGRIVNIGSIVGLRGYNGLSVYSATKAALDGITRSLARELGRRDITVNTIAPGYLETEMSSRLRAEQKQQIVGRTPLRRLGTPDDVYPVLRFLLSDASGFITGQTFAVDGGVIC